MIKIKQLTLRNFLSIGNAFQTLNFNREELVLVLGENLDLGGEDSGSRNGVGKTTICNGLSYALYGWPISDIKKEHLINKSNSKNMLVTIDFEANDKQYRIVRGLKPRILEFYENGKQQNKEEVINQDDSAQGDSRETQKEIEKVLGMSHDMFCQIVVLNTYSTPFLFQKVAEQRTIIEQLLGITLLSEKAEKLKEEIKTMRDDILREEVRIKSVQAANNRIQEQINSLIRKQKIWTKSKNESIEKLNKSIAFLSKVDINKELVLHSAWDEYNKVISDKATLNQRKSQLNALLIKEEKLLSRINLDLISLENQCCHTCNQKIKGDVHESLVAKLTIEQSAANSEIEIISGEIAELNEGLLLFPDMQQPETKNYDNISDAYDHKNKLNLLIQEQEQKQKEIDPYNDQILDMQNTAIEVVDMSTINALTSFVDHQEFLLKLLTNKDSFIRKKIIEQNLSYLNVRLDHYLENLGLPHSVVFQNDLNVNITELGRELSSGNLSRGEMARLSLGLSFAFRDVYENLYQKINLLAIDESLDAGLDTSGTDAAIKLLRDMSREQSRDVWVISHKEELASKCSSILTVTKENGYTSYSFD